MKTNISIIKKNIDINEINGFTFKYPYNYKSKEGDFETLAEWIKAKSGNLVAENRIEIAECITEGRIWKVKLKKMIRKKC